MLFTNFIQRAGLEVIDLLRTRNLSRGAAAAKYLFARMNLLGERRPEIAMQCAASWSHTSLGPWIVGRERAHSANGAKREPPCRKAGSFPRTLVLKAPAENERGVLLLSFEDEIERLSELINFEAIERRYKILYMPSTKGVVSIQLLKLLDRARRTVGIMPSYLDSELPMVNALGPKAEFLPFHAASWVHGSSYRQAWTNSKPIDLLMVATFASLKRHWLLFKALAALPENIRTVIVGVPIGRRNRDSLIREANLFGVDRRISIVENPPQAELRSLYAQAKLFCAFTHREGSFIAVVEALLANTPVVAFSNAEFGTKRYICPKTGFLLDRNSFSGASLMKCLEGSIECRPGHWAQEHLSAEVNCSRLNDLLRKSAIDAGEAWTTDIESFFSERLKFHYARPLDQCAGLSETISELKSLGMKIA